MRFQPRGGGQPQAQTVDLVFAAWEPDKGEIGNPMLVAKNVLPDPVGYTEFLGLSDTGAAMTSTPNSVFWASDEDGTFHSFAGGETTLNLWSGSAWTELNSGYTSTTRWDFVEINSRVIAVSQENVPVYYDLGVSSEFEVLPNENPTAATVEDDFSTYADDTELQAVWDNVSGFAPEIDTGNDRMVFNISAAGNALTRASFTLVPGVTYSLLVANNAVSAGPLTISAGTSAGGAQYGSQGPVPEGTVGVVAFTATQATVWVQISMASAVAPEVQFAIDFVRFSEVAPAARTIATVRDFVVLGGLTGNAGAVQWSGFNNSEVWGTNASLQADRQVLQGRSGEVLRIIGGDEGYIFTTEGIYRMTYVGPPVIFQFDRIRDTVGTEAPDSCVKFESIIWYYSKGGFTAFDGQQPFPIGENRVDKWFAENVLASRIDDIQATADRKNRRIIWAFSQTQTTYNDTLLVYDLASKKWSYAEVDTKAIGEWAGGTAPEVLELIAFDTDDEQETFTGSALTAEIATGPWQPGGVDGRFKVQDVQTIVEGDGSATITLEVARDQDTDAASLTYGSAISRDAEGRHHVDLEGRWFQFRMNISGGFGRAYLARIVGYLTGRI